jgi:hypothetical protein
MSFFSTAELILLHFQFSFSHFHCIALHYIHFYSVRKIPGGLRVQVFLGTSFILGLSAIPVFYKPSKRGHDLFSQEKPEEVENHQNKLKQQYRDAKREQQGQQ